jgi:hypothetical protein
MHDKGIECHHVRHLRMGRQPEGIRYARFAA